MFYIVLALFWIFVGIFWIAHGISVIQKGNNETALTMRKDRRHYVTGYICFFASGLAFLCSFVQILMYYGVK